MEKCLNIIVYYDNYDEVKKYIDCAFSCSDGCLDIVIVINKDESSQISVLEKYAVGKYKEAVRFIDYGKNVGYLNALLKTVQKIDLNSYRYIILSNTDIQYVTLDFYKQLLKKSYAKNIGCIAPSVFNPKTNSYSNPHYRERISKQKFQRLYFIFSNATLGLIYLRLAGLKSSKKDTVEQSSQYVYSPHGCFMIFTKEFVGKIVGFEYGVKMYSEESCVGELLKQHGMKCYFDSSLRVTHNESTVTGKIDYRKRFKLWRESIGYILKEFY